MKKKVCIKKSIMKHLPADLYEKIISAMKSKYKREIDNQYLQAVLNPTTALWDDDIISEAQILILTRNEVIIENKEAQLQKRINNFRGRKTSETE